MPDYTNQTQSAKLAAEYWLTLTPSEEPNEWAVRVLGPTPWITTITAPNEEQARIGAAKAAAQYFHENEIDVTVPDSLRWSATTKMSFKVPV